MTSFDERLREILLKTSGDEHDKGCGDRGCDVLYEQITAIKKLISEMVPDEADPKHIPFNNDSGCDEQYGCGCRVQSYNSYRTELKKRLNLSE